MLGVGKENFKGEPMKNLTLLLLIVILTGCATPSYKDFYLMKQDVDEVKANQIHLLSQLNPEFASVKERLTIVEKILSMEDEAIKREEKKGK